CSTMPARTSSSLRWHKKNGYEGSSITCSGCQQAADFHGYRDQHGILSLLGPFRLSRASYYCGRCGQGYFPFDEQARLSPRKLTPAAEQVTVQAGLLTDGFAEAAQKILPVQAGLHLAESTVQRVTEDAGARLGGWWEQGFTLGEEVRWCWH